MAALLLLLALAQAPSSPVQVKAVLEDSSVVLSGVVYSKDGYILTHAGGLKSAKTIEVTVGDRSWTAERIGSDARSGVAVLKVPADDLVPVVFVDAPCEAGARVILTGRTTAPGVVIGAGRRIGVGGRIQENMIQVSAEAHPGDGGGFVADSEGRLVGMIQSAGTTAPEDGGMGDLLAILLRNEFPGPRVYFTRPVVFVTPADAVAFSAKRIIAHRKMVRGWVGLSARLVPGVGAQIVRVEPAGPARRARLSTRDVLVEFDGAPVTDLAALARKVAAYEAPAKVRMVAMRDGERREVELDVDLEPQEEIP